MKIIIDTDNSVRFASLNPGDVFALENVMYMKCNAFHGEVANAVCLGLGKICMFELATKVYPVEAELHVSKL